MESPRRTRCWLMESETLGRQGKGPGSREAVRACGDPASKPSWYRWRNRSLLFHDRSQEHFRFLRLDAENDELLARQALLETLLVQLVLLRREAQQPLALVGDPLPRTLD